MVTSLNVFRLNFGCFLISSLSVSCLVHIILLDFITLIKSGEKFNFKALRTLRWETNSWWNSMIEDHLLSLSASAYLVYYQLSYAPGGRSSIYSLQSRNAMVEGDPLWFIWFVLNMRFTSVFWEPFLFTDFNLTHNYLLISSFHIYLFLLFLTFFSSIRKYPLIYHVLLSAIERGRERETDWLSHNFRTNALRLMYSN